MLLFTHKRVRTAEIFVVVVFIFDFFHFMILIFNSKSPNINCLYIYINIYLLDSYIYKHIYIYIFLFLFIYILPFLCLLFDNSKIQLRKSQNIIFANYRAHFFLLDKFIKNNFWLSAPVKKQQLRER